VPHALQNALERAPIELLVVDDENVCLAQRGILRRSRRGVTAV